MSIKAEHIERLGFNELIHKAINNNASIAIWRKPEDKSIYLLINEQPNTLHEIPIIEKIDKGFIFFPFDEQGKAKGVLFQADVLLQYKNNQVQLIEADLNSSFVEVLLKDRPQIKDFYHTKITTKETEKENWIAYLKQIKSAISLGKFEKVVASRTSHIKFNGDIISLFKSLDTSYPKAFISLVSSPLTGTWIGASPETLISIDRNKQFKTIALAGTQEADKETKEIAWRQKEIEEQAFVSRYIVNCFKQIRLREFSEKGPKTIIAANLAHLKTEYSIDLNKIKQEQLASTLLKLLHPTPAVCGMEQGPAKAFIKAHENLDRKYYSGFLGPINIKQETNLFVNLRCMEIDKEQGLLYAGAGITRDSVNNKEWVETELKCNTLLEIINKPQ